MNVYSQATDDLFRIYAQIWRKHNGCLWPDTIGEAGKMLSFNALFVWVQFVVVFWVGSLTGKKTPETVPEGVPVPAQQQQ